MNNSEKSGFFSEIVFSFLQKCGFFRVFFFKPAGRPGTTTGYLQNKPTISETHALYGENTQKQAHGFVKILLL